SDNITLMGSSAGGAIALSLLHLNRDFYHIPICGAFIMYPPTSDKLNTLSMRTYGNAPMQTYKSAHYMWKHYLSRTSEKWNEYAVPNQMIDFWLLPKITLVLAECDPLIDEAKQYADLVLARGGEVVIWEIKGAVHTFDFFDCELTTNFTRDKIAYFKKLHLL
ncbi:MAG: alpha/beta hydrolase fold domain-containing protein, partial [Flavobacterium sp.]